MILSRLFPLLALPLSLLAVAQQCPGDKTGCWMCPGSPLMQCLDGASSAVSQCLAKQSDQAAQVRCLCAAYTWTADCWAVGTNCLEWRPNAIAAQKMCVLADSFSTNPNAAAPPSSNTSSSTSSVSSVPSETLSSLIVEQSQVASSIWHDDSGTDIPSLSPPSTLPAVPATTKLTDAFASAMSALSTSAPSGASYVGPSVVTDSGARIVTATGQGSVVSGQATTVGGGNLSGRATAGPKASGLERLDVNGIKLAAVSLFAAVGAWSI